MATLEQDHEVPPDITTLKTFYAKLRGNERLGVTTAITAVFHEHGPQEQYRLRRWVRAQVMQVDPWAPRTNP